MEKARQFLIDKGIDVTKHGKHDWDDNVVINYMKEYAEYYHKQQKDDSYTMLKDWFTESDDGEGGTISMADCPNCHDTVVYNDGCIKCEANFKFK